MRFFQRLGIALLGTCLLGLYGRYPALAFLNYFALVPWIVLYTDDRRPGVGFGYYALAAYLTWPLQNAESFNFGWYAGLGMAAVWFVAWLPFVPILRRLHGRFRLPRTVSVPLAWVSVEWLRSTFGLGHFDLYGLGYSQARFPVLIQISDIVGSYGLSFLLAAVNGWIADLWFAGRDRGWSARDLFRIPRVRIGIVAILGAFLVVLAYGGFRLATIRHRPGPTLALVQPNIPHSQANIVGVHLTQLMMSQRAVEPGEVDLIVWPENAILDNIRREGVYLDDLAWVGRDKGSWFLVGALGKSEEHPGRTTNTAFLVSPEGEIMQAYEKQILFPWGEYVPGERVTRRVWPGFYRFHRWITRMGWGHLPSGQPGDRMVLFDLPWNGETLRFSSLICVENIYPPVPASAGRLGARFFVNIVSEGTVGGPMQEQLMRVAILRAVENRLSYVRVGNTGITAVIDTAGRLQSILRDARGATINTAGVLVAPVPLGKETRTLYARSGDLFVRVVVLATAVLLVISFFGRRRHVATVTLGASLLLAGCFAPPDLGNDPARVDDELAAGRRLAADSRYGEAIRHLAAACATEEGCRLGMPYLAASYENSKDDDRAVMMFAQIAERYPALEAEALANQGVFLNRALEVREAITAYQRSLSLDPTPEVYGRLGTIFMRTEKVDDALAMFREGSAAFPDDAKLRHLLGRALRIRRDYEAARAVLEELIAADPKHGSAWVNLGRVRWRQGDPEGAAEAFRTALRVEPANIEARFMLARQALQRGDLDEVDRMIREIRRIEAGRR